MKWIDENHKAFENTYASVVRVVFIHHRVHNIANNYGLNVVEQHVNPHAKDSDGEAVADEQNRFVMKRVADRDGRNHEACVWEHHSPPAEVEVTGPLVNNLVYILADGLNLCE